MKRIISIVLVACIISTLFGCNRTPGNDGAIGSKPLPEITMEEIAWTVSAGTVNGHPHVLLSVTNNSSLTLKYLKISFTEKDGVTKEEKEKLYADIQKTQGFDDEYMEKFIANYEDTPISMYGYTDSEIAPGATLDENKCYYFGGLTSKYVVYPDLFVPQIAEYKFDSNGVAYTIFYNFEIGSYEIDSELITTESQPGNASTSSPVGNTPSDNTSGDFKAAMDSYEAFIISYVDFMNLYLASSDHASMVDEYTSFMLQYADTMQKISEINAEELSSDDYAYYIDVHARIMKKLLEIGNPNPPNPPSDAVSPEFKEAMDGYELFFTEYVDFMNRYLSSDDPASLLDDYNQFIQQYADTMQKISEINSNELSSADYAYYVDVLARINKKLLEVGNPVPPEDDNAILDAKYNSAIELMDSGKYEEAIAVFEALDGYKDSKKKITECKNAISEIKYCNAIALMNEGKYTEAIAEFEELGKYKDSKDKLNECKSAITEMRYNEAIALMDTEQYEEAIAAFEQLGSYKDSADKLIECRYSYATGLMNAGNVPAAAIEFGKLGNWSDSYELSKSLWDQFAERETISAHNGTTIGLKSNGTVVSAGVNYYGECDVSDWSGIMAISAGDDHTVGLKSDGTVVAVGWSDDDRCDVSGWTDIVAISAGGSHTVGLKTDGTVVACGGDSAWRNSNIGAPEGSVYDWTDIVAICAGYSHTVGLKADGTVVAVGWNLDSQCDVSNWTNIVAISAGASCTVGLKADGTVVICGQLNDGMQDAFSWTNIVAISAGAYYIVGLKADGTVVACGSNGVGQCDVSDWHDIVAISAGYDHTIGLKTDGTVVICGRFENYSGQPDVSDWEKIKHP